MQTSKYHARSAKMRVQIAEDVLELLKSKLLKVSGLDAYYLKVAKVEDNLVETTDATKNVELREIIGDRKCKICAIGGLVVAALRRHDKFTVGDALTRSFCAGNCVYMNDRAWIIKYLERYFDMDQLILIEETFERQQSDLGPSLEFSDRYITQGRLLRAIMLNIIKNEGEFKP